VTRVAWWRLGLVGLAVGAVEALCRVGLIDRFTMIPPSEMAWALGRLLASGRAAADIAFTLRNLVAAVALSVAGGFALGAVVHGIPRWRRLLDPLFSSYYSVPTFVFYPLLIVIFGIGPTSLVVMGAMFGVVAMVVNTLTGLDRVPRVFRNTARVLRLGRLRTALLVALPAAAPHLMTGVKLAVAYSVIGVVAGEFILATAGVGRRIAFAYHNFDNQTMYGMLLFILVVVAAANALLQRWERRLHERWYRR
jgi:NitT/TauT family transport system permease protein